jgi:hypothetical protein
VALVASAYGGGAILFKRTMQGLWHLTNDVMPHPHPQQAAPRGSLVLSGGDTVGDIKTLLRLPPAVESVTKDSGIVLVGVTRSNRWKQQIRNMTGMRAAHLLVAWNESLPIFVELNSRDTVPTRALLGRLVLDSGVVFRLYQ